MHLSGFLASHRRPSSPLQKSDRSRRALPKSRQRSSTMFSRCPRRKEHLEYRHGLLNHPPSPHKRSPGYPAASSTESSRQSIATGNSESVLRKPAPVLQMADCRANSLHFQLPGPPAPRKRKPPIPRSRKSAASLASPHAKPCQSQRSRRMRAWRGVHQERQDPTGRRFLSNTIA